MKTSCFYSSIITVMAVLSMMKAQASEPDQESLSQKGTTYVFECAAGGGEFVVDINDNGSWLFREQQTLKLSEPSGLVSYTAPGMELLIHGENAVLREVGQTTLFCKNNPGRAIWEHAKLTGVDFRAVGNEPGWSLEFIAGKQIVFISNYGSNRVERPLPEAVSNEASRTTRWLAEGLTIEVRAKDCQDNMSGEAYESSVTVYWNDQQFYGCGKALH